MCILIHESIFAPGHLYHVATDICRRYFHSCLSSVRDAHICWVRGVNSHTFGNLGTLYYWSAGLIAPLAARGDCGQWVLFPVACTRLSARLRSALSQICIHIESTVFLCVNKEIRFSLRLFVPENTKIPLSNIC